MGRPYQNDELEREKVLSLSVRVQLGRRLKRAREAAGLSQDQAAARLGKHKNALSRYERGVCEPTLAQLHRFAELYGVTVACLVDPAHATGLAAVGLQAVIEGAA